MSTNTSALSADKIEEILRDCLFSDEELPAGYETPPEDAVMVEGIINTYGFHPGRLESHREEVKAMLEELPDDYRLSGGGGMTFLNMCEDKHGHQWTGLHRTMENLCCLAIGLGLAQWTLPRKHWEILYGGMPYFTYLDVEQGNGN